MRKITAWLDGFTPLMDNITKEYGLFSAAVCGRIWRYEQGENQVCYASQQRIADDLGISLRTVAREIKRLIELNYIIDLTPDLKNKPHSYRTTERIGIEINISAMPESHSTMPESHSTMPESHSHYDSESREDTKKIQVKKQNGIVSLPDFMQSSPEFLKTWNDFIEHRKQIRKKLTTLAAERVIKKLSGYAMPTIIAALEKSIESGWQGVFPESINSNGQLKQPESQRLPKGV